MQIKVLVLVQIVGILPWLVCCQWNEWSSCSQSCGGGAAYQTKTGSNCSRDNCAANSIRYKICNFQGCPDESEDSRTRQCAYYNRKPYRGQLHNWNAAFYPKTPCVLICSSVETRFRVAFAPKVVDGTPCGEDVGSLDTCIDGKCRKVGCDLIVDSSLRKDDCGVCDGDNLSCQKTTFMWKRQPVTSCSVSCGVGYQIVKYTCEHIESGRRVSNRYCRDRLAPPHASKVKCQQAACTLWIGKVWKKCSRSCGDGVRYRQVHCVRVRIDGSLQDTLDHACPPPKPHITKSCHEGPCPSHAVEKLDKSENGINEDHITHQNVHDTRQHEINLDNAIKNMNIHKIRHVGKKEIKFREQNLGALHTKTENSEKEAQFQFRIKQNVLELSTMPTTPAAGHLPVINKTLPTALPELYTTIESTTPEQITRKLPVLPTYFATKWGPCSTSCGPGVLRRSLSCKVFLPYAASIVEVPMSKCADQPKPEDRKSCEIMPCSDEDGTSYYWHIAGYGGCTVSCGETGIQQAILQCLRRKDKREMYNLFCGDTPRHGLTRRCGKASCPPSWDIGPMGPCSGDCGGGTMSRHVICVQSQNSTHRTVLSDSRCGIAKPVEATICNPHDCDALWVPLSWSRCSVTCGQGVERRKMLCQQILYPLKLVTHNDESLCLDPKPQTERSCIRSNCPDPGGPAVEMQILKYVQMKKRKRLKVKYAKSISVLLGTTVTMNCPLINSTVNNTEWYSKGVKYNRKGRIKITKMGALRVNDARFDDKGVYICKSDTGKINMTLNFITLFEAQHFLNERRKFIPKTVNLSKYMSNALSNFQYFSSLNEVLKPPVIFVPASWSVCSSSCGSIGVQVRDITCEHVKKESFYVLPPDTCVQYKVHKPPYAKTCGIPVCPMWIAGNWSECQSNVCVRPGYGTMERKLDCIFPNGTKLKHKICAQIPKPFHRRECSNIHCVTVWKTSPWSKCAGLCGSKGIQTRRFKCVWMSSGLPAGPTCRGKSRPAGYKQCETVPCQHTECLDRSRLCSLVLRLQMCRYHSYRKLCCKSCKHYQS